MANVWSLAGRNLTLWLIWRKVFDSARNAHSTHGDMALGFVGGTK